MAERGSAEPELEVPSPETLTREQLCSALRELHLDLEKSLENHTKTIREEFRACGQRQSDSNCICVGQSNVVRRATPNPAADSDASAFQGSLWTIGADDDDFVCRHVHPAAPHPLLEAKGTASTAIDSFEADHATSLLPRMVDKKAAVAIPVLSIPPVVAEPNETKLDERKASVCTSVQISAIQSAIEDGEQSPGKTARLAATSSSTSQKLRKSKKKDVKTSNQPVKQDLPTSAFDFKEKVKQSVMKPVYDVTKYYSSVGLWQYIARSQAFEFATLATIGINSIWIWIDTDHNSADAVIEAEPIFQVAENLFCVYFTTELLVRYKSFECKRNCLRDLWFLFDTALVVLMVLETWLLSFAILFLPGFETGGVAGNTALLRMCKLLRLSRAFRMARLVRACPELSILIKGMLASMRSVLTTLVLLTIVMYLFALVFAQTTKGSPIGDERFNTVPASMNTLWCYGVLSLDFAEDISSDLSEQVSFVLAGIYYIFVLLAAFTVMNMLIGVLCEVVSAVAYSEKEAAVMMFAKSKLAAILNSLDIDSNGKISRDEFELLVDRPEACRLLHELGVDVASLPDYKEVIFETAGEGEEISLEAFVDQLLQMRGSKAATVKDVVELRKLTQNAQAELRKLIYTIAHDNQKAQTTTQNDEDDESPRQHRA